MQIALNVPRLSDADYEQFIEETYQHWMRGVKRNPNRSHPGVSRARCREVQKQGIPLMDLIEEEHRDELERSLPSWAKGDLDEDSDEDIDNPLSQYTCTGGKPANVDTDSSSVKGITTSELQKCHGPYECRQGFSVLPAPSPEIYANLYKKMTWNDKRIAMLWCNGWADGMFKGPRQFKGKIWHAVMIDGWDQACPLALDDYGCDKGWVIIQRNWS